MLVTFQAKTYGNITMFGEVGVELLKLGGMTGNVPTAILAPDVPGFLGRLERGLQGRAQEERRGRTARPDGAQPADEKGAEPAIPLRKRALPLMALLRSAADARTDVIVSVLG